MTDQTNQPSRCAEVEERMADILDGTAPDDLLDHIADCDVCRDARHDAEELAALTASAGADYRPAPDLEARLLRALGDAPSETPETSEQRPLTGPVPSSDEVAFAKTLASTPPRTLEPESAASSASERSPTTERMPETGTAPAASAAQPEREPEREPERRREHEQAAKPDLQRPVPKTVLAKPAFGKRRIAIVASVAGALAAAAAGVLVLRGQSTDGQLDGDGWRGEVVNVSSASGGSDGLELCDPEGKNCRPLADAEPVPAGSLLVTNERTRAHVRMADGTDVVLDRGTRLALSGEESRQARLESGAIVADVAKREKLARFDLPKGHVQVLGTKFSLRTDDGSTAVDVSRGAVELVDEQGRKVTVRAGEEGRAFAGVPPYVTAAPALGEAIAWSESTIAEREAENDAVVRGLGELKAKKPSSDQELSGAVTLTSHKVKVRISGAMARTEVDETFTNHTDDVLEGIFRFPIPPDAKIERLALEVDGKLEEGAFLDRDRAAAIWRGAIVNAAPQKRQQIRDEIVWVPGPWKDPALLEWQRGGRFELRIYPIPKRGARRVVLAYTQVLAPTGGVRRYNYPLAHDPSGSTKVDDFQVDVQVRGHDGSFGVKSQGYQLARSKSNGADSLTLAERQFVPSGDLTLEFALPNRDAELTAWAFRPPADERAQKREKVASASAKLAKNEPGKPSAEPIRANDDQAYVALALRPKLPRRREDAQRTFAIVVDSSRSMFGESYRRARLVATKTIRELDPRDRFSLLACDTDCRAMPGGLQTPGAQAATDADRFLEGITPEGGSDPTAAVRNARALTSSAVEGELRVVFIGDGTPTVGPIRPAYVTRAVEEAIPPGKGTLTTVAIGADSDLDTLSAMARGGGGVVLPFVPGQSTAEAAYALLGATYGNALRDVRVELPAGLTEVAPKSLDTIISGSEQLLVARMNENQIEGTVVIRGKLGKQSFEQRYPLKIAASDTKGNAFVPRLFAATRIADLERETGADAKKEAIRLSSEFDVASRYTSLLVLESEAMFKAFGLDNTRSGIEWTGEEEAQAAVADGLDAIEDSEEAAAFGGAPGSKAKTSMGPMKLDSFDGAGTGTGGGGFAQSAPRPKPASPPPAESERSAEAKKEAPRDDQAWSPARRRPPIGVGGRRMIPMRRIFERKGTLALGQTTPVKVTRSAIADAELELERNPNRREAVKQLYVLHSLAGDVEQASSIAERWSEKEPLDPDALTARADLASRSGDRELAIRILGSVVDVRPGDVPAQKRLARLHRWAGRPAVGCRHSIAIAQLKGGDANLLAEAVSCGRQTGESRLAEDMLQAAEERVRKSALARIAVLDKQTDDLSGDLRVEASWVGAGHDLDLALLTPDGHRVSWLGAPTKSVITARDVASTNREGLALRGAKPGEYVIEITRASGNGPVSGELTVTVAGTKRTIPFSLDGVRQTLGVAQITMQSRLVPIDRPFW